MASSYRLARSFQLLLKVRRCAIGAPWGKTNGAAVCAMDFLFGHRH
jgi:hypothetical protein